LPLLENVSVHLTLSPCLEPLHPVFKSLKVNFEFIDALRVNADWSAVHLLLHLKSNILVQLKNQLYLKMAHRLSKKQKLRETS